MSRVPAWFWTCPRCGYLNVAYAGDGPGCCGQCGRHPYQQENDDDN